MGNTNIEILLAVLVATVFLGDFIWKKVKGRKTNQESSLEVEKDSASKAKNGLKRLSKLRLKDIFLILFITFIIITSIFIFLSNTFNSPEGKLNKSINLSETVSHISLTKNGKYFVVAQQSKGRFEKFNPDYIPREFDIHIYSVDNFGLVKTLRGHNADIESIDISFDSKTIVSVDDDGNLILWDLPSGKQNSKLKFAKGGMRKVMFTSSGQEIISLKKYDKLASLYSLTGTLLTQFEVDVQIDDFEINQIRNEVIFGCHDEIQIWSLNSRKMIKKIDFSRLSLMKFNNDFSKLAIGTISGDIIFFNDNLDLVSKLSGHFKSIQSLSYSFNDKYLCSGSSDQTIRIWDLEKLKNIIQLDNEHKGTIEAVQFISKKNQFVTGGRNNELKIWK